jgi:Flp pilus assembly protein TadB
VDALLFRVWQSVFQWWRRISTPERERPDDLLLIGRIIASVRAGLSLDSALQELLQKKEISPRLKSRIHALLRSEPEADFLSSFLDGALRAGIPVLTTLQTFQRILQAERRIKIRARSLTSQSRAQAEVLSWLPWLLLCAIAVLDGEWLAQAMASSLSWFCLGLAMGFLGLGKMWMNALLAKVLAPKDEEEEIQEKSLPELILRTLAEISLGMDAETALEKSLEKMAGKELSSRIMGAKAPGEAIGQLRSLLQYASKTGAPLREDLMHLFNDLQLQTEGRWEERAQRLPVVMLAPLFLCFFPSCLLVLAGIMLPLLQEAL